MIHREAHFGIGFQLRPLNEQMANINSDCLEEFIQKILDKYDTNNTYEAISWGDYDTEHNGAIILNWDNYDYKLLPLIHLQLEEMEEFCIIHNINVSKNFGLVGGLKEW